MRVGFDRGGKIEEAELTWEGVTRLRRPEAGPRDDAGAMG